MLPQTHFIAVTVKSIILFGLWAKIPFPHLATSEIPTWVRPWMYNKDGVHESHVRLTPLEDF